jgi:hypothetical protein
MTAAVRLDAKDHRMRYSIVLATLFSIALYGAACGSAKKRAGQAADESQDRRTNSAEGTGAAGDASEQASGAGRAATGCVLGDCQSGQGTYVWPSGSKYAGQFQNGLREGTGTYTWPSGSQYIGEYKSGLRHGRGAYHWSDGHSYVGEFHGDQKHGQGVYTWPDGTVFEGAWENNQRGEGRFSQIPNS